MEKFHMLKKTKLIFFLTVTMSLFFFPFHSFAKGKIYGQSKTLSKEYTKYEKCRLKKTLLNIKDGEKDGYKCVYKRQKKGKDVTVFQPSAICQKSFKCKQENQ
jgi:hypothetical protein